MKKQSYLANMWKIEKNLFYTIKIRRDHVFKQVKKYIQLKM